MFPPGDAQLIVPFAIAIAVIVVLLVIMWVAFAKEPGPGPADVAIAYEGAWDTLDFDLLYDLSGEELRDGLRRDQFIAAKKAAYSGARTTRGSAPTSRSTTSSRRVRPRIVATRVTTDEGSVHNRVMLERRATGWMVVGYSIRAG